MGGLVVIISSLLFRIYVEHTNLLTWKGFAQSKQKKTIFFTRMNQLPSFKSLKLLTGITVMIMVQVLYR